MDTLKYKTVSVNKESADKKWLVVDAKGQKLGRFASKIAYMLRGKHKPTYTPHSDTGDNIVVINAEHIELTGNKAFQKEYIRYTNYPGGQIHTSYKEMSEKHPARVIEMAVKGMLPKNRLGRAIFGNLHVYTGPEHPHEGQKPENLNINTIK